MSWFRRRDIWLIPTIYVLFGLALFFMQDRLIFLPDTTPTAQCPTPGETLDTQTGLRGYYVPVADATGLVVVYHGNAGRACHRHFYVEPVHEADHSLLLIEYPGYGETAAHPNVQTLLDHTYVVADHIETLPYQSITLIGESIGSGFASYHATHQDIDHLLLISPLDTLSRRTQRAVLFYPTRWLLRTDLLVSEWAQSAPRTTIIIAERDEVIPVSHSKSVYAALPEERRTLFTIPEARHNTLYNKPAFQEALVTALAKDVVGDHVEPE